MKIRWNPTLISTALLSLCLATFIPGGLRLAATWRNLYFEWQQNLAAPIGFSSLGFAIIGLIILWTGYIGSIHEIPVKPVRLCKSPQLFDRKALTRCKTHCRFSGPDRYN